MTFLGGLALGALIIAFLGTIVTLLLNGVVGITSEILLDGWLSNFNFLSPNANGGLPSHAKVLEEIFFTGSGGQNGVLSIFFGIAWIIFAISFIVQLFKLLGDPGSGSKTPALGTTILRYLIFAFLLAFCYRFLDMILQWYTSLIQSATSLLTNNLKAGVGNIDVWFNDQSLISNWDDPGWYIFFCMMTFGLVSSVIGCMLNYVERYVGFAIYIYLSPMCVAMGVNDETRDVFKKWMMGVISQMFAIMLSIILMAAAYKALTMDVAINFKSVVDKDGIAMYSIQMLMATVLFSAAKNSERFFNMLGFSTMNYGDAARTFLGGAGATLMAARSLGKLGFKGGEKGAEAVQKRRNSGFNFSKDGKPEKKFGGKLLDSQAQKSAMEKQSTNQKGANDVAEATRNSADLKNAVKNAADANATKQAAGDALKSKQDELAKQIDVAGGKPGDMARSDARLEKAKENETRALDTMTKKKDALDDAKQDYNSAKDAYEKNNKDLDARANYKLASDNYKDAQNEYRSAERNYDKAANDRLQAQKEHDLQTEYAANASALNGNFDEANYDKLVASPEAEAYRTASKNAEDAGRDVSSMTKSYMQKLGDSYQPFTSDETRMMLNDTSGKYNYSDSKLVMDSYGNMYDQVTRFDAEGKDCGTINMLRPGAEYNTDGQKSIQGASLMYVGGSDDGKPAGYILNSQSGDLRQNENGMNYISSSVEAPVGAYPVQGESSSDAMQRFNATREQNEMFGATGGGSALGGISHQGQPVKTPDGGNILEDDVEQRKPDEKLDPNDFPDMYVDD